MGTVRGQCAGTRKDVATSGQAVVAGGMVPGPVRSAAD